MPLSFADQLAAFRVRTADPGFAGLILRSTERHNITAGLLLGALRLRRVAFLTTPQTRDFPQYIADLLGICADTWEIPKTDHGDTSQVYQSIKALRKLWGDITDPARIAVDVPGGRKSMSVGLEKAAHILGLRTIYVVLPLPARCSRRRSATLPSRVPTSPRCSTTAAWS
jgi:hypothetical protein